ncbi:MAG: hypothetical protein PHW76_06705 [Alphaproteobacteria bacterium]|nr:hypothetical protein [Alphaproteobacteria bacterium]
MTDTCADVPPKRKDFIKYATELTKQMPGIIMSIAASAAVQMMFYKAGAALTMAFPGKSAPIMVVGVGVVMAGFSRTTVAAMSDDERDTASLPRKFLHGAAVGVFGGLYGLGLAKTMLGL